MRCALVVLAALPVAVGAGPLDEPHLRIAPHAEAVPPPTFDPGLPDSREAMPGGVATVPASTGPDAFSHPPSTLYPAQELDFLIGNALFRKEWQPAPAALIASDGLGPLFNARSCEDCHIRDGRGNPPVAGADEARSIVMKLSMPGGVAIAGIEDYLASLPDPVYGGQIQDRALPGHATEAHLSVAWTEIPVALAGGEVILLRRPAWSLTDPAYGPLAAEVTTSVRVAPQMIGLGLLEAIPATDILALADEGDADGDGISGRANVVWSEEYGMPMLGRFGLKAGVPTLRQQTADAFATDIGISSPLHPDGWGDCTLAQAACRAAPDGREAATGRLEIDTEGLDILTLYSRNLAVPARRDIADPQVTRGRTVFHDVGCTSCHRPAFVTHRLEDRPQHSDQTIWPWTDLLLHDMGEGLADGRPEARATGREWRTPPLWGIGLTAQVSGHTQFLHDGRARSLMEAILWHGGEALAARDRVVALPPEDRAALIRFLESL